jgi:hypothetical protein
MISYCIKSHVAVFQRRFVRFNSDHRTYQLTSMNHQCLKLSAPCGHLQHAWVWFDWRSIIITAVFIPGQLEKPKSLFCPRLLTVISHRHPSSQTPPPLPIVDPWLSPDSFFHVNKTDCLGCCCCCQSRIRMTADIRSALKVFTSHNLPCKRGKRKT